ncbi:MAG: MotA/TolQ/ExbB proton channel family protein [Phascolarctobacterium sp.]|nr:MotA/TolQ/ExbB proton channel family protein [Candidatus Phascolarctobacterium caballi]
MDFVMAPIDYFLRGGLCMWPLLACSIGAIFIGRERFQYFKNCMSGTKFTLDFEDLMNKGQLQEALDLAKNTKGDGAALCAEMMTDYKEYGKRFQSVVFFRIDRIIGHMNDHMNMLGVIIGLSPMLGLLGTITGMISSFNALNERMANPMAVTAGIGEALITTVFGLVISIVAMCLHAYLTRRIKGAALDLDELGSVLVDVLAKKE